MPQSLEDLLVQTKLISAPQLAVAQRDAEIRHTPLARTIIDLGLVSDRQFAEWAGGVTKIPVVDPLRPEVVSEFQMNMPAAIAREYAVVPLDVNADEMTIATVDPLDSACIDAVHSATGMKIQPVIGILSQIMALVDRFYPKPPEFDPSATVSVSEVDPFVYGDDTMLRNHSREFAYSRGNDSLGSETRVLPAPGIEEPAPPPAPASEAGKPMEKAPHTQLDRIERHLTELIRIVEALQRRVDAIDSTLARIVHQR